MSHSLGQNSSYYQHESKGVEVFVGGLARSLTEDKVHKVFATCGEIVDVRLIKDQNGNPKGFGFVRFATKEAADRAVKELSGSMLEGKKIGVLPSAAQDTLFLGNLNKGWSADDFDKVVRQVFPDVVSIDLALPKGGTAPGKNFQNRGFAFVKFSSHASASRAFRAGSSPGFILGGTLHPSVRWAEEETQVDPDELAKITIAFIRKLPSSADETYINRLFAPFGKIDKVVVSSKGDSSVGFVHFTQRSHLDDAINGLNGKFVQGPKGGPSIKLQVEVARPMDKKRKRVHEDPHNTQHSRFISKPESRNQGPAWNSFDGHEEILQKEPVVADPYEDAVLLLTMAVRERLLRILRLGIATRYDIEVESLANLAELPESTAISVLDQFMLSGADERDKGAYLAGLIARHQVGKHGVNQLPSSLSRSSDIDARDSGGLFGRVRLSVVDPSVPRSESYAPRYPPLYSDYHLSRPAGVPRTEERSPLHLHEFPGSSTAPPYTRYLPNSHLPTAYANMEEMSPVPSHQIPGLSSTLYPKPAQDSYQIPASSVGFAKGASGDRPPTRPQMRFDPFTGQPYKFDPFTGEPIVPESHGSPY